MIPFLAAYLATGRPQLARGHAGHGTPDLGFVFLADPRPHGGRTPLPGGALGENGLYQLLSWRWRAAGGTGGFGWHRLRHGVGTAIGEVGNLVDIMARLNHKSERSARRYLHPTPDHVAELVTRSAWAALDRAAEPLPGATSVGTLPVATPDLGGGAVIRATGGAILRVLPGRTGPSHATAAS